MIDQSSVMTKIDKDKTMRAMVLREAGGKLQPERRAIPEPQHHEVLVRVSACGVCRTDLHVQDNELPDIAYPIVPGHQVVGNIIATGAESILPIGSRVGITWLAQTCGTCEFCRSGRENLCDDAKFNGYQVNGGFADFMLADSRFCLPLDDALPAAETTPLLCAGLIGFRSLRMAGDAKRIGIYGFGSAAHIITQVAVHEKRLIYAFTRSGDEAAQSFALRVGATWAGDSDHPAPEKLDAALIFAPDGRLVPKALTDLKKGGIVICGGIHMSDIPSFPYADLWEERHIRSVANLTRADGADFMSLVGHVPIHPEITTYPLEAANDALDDLRSGAINGTAVLVMD
jgi:propanol-preferring alcohol dehydrogenase